MKLYSYFRSSAAYRVRIALNLKGLPYDILPVHLLRDGGQHCAPDYTERNPDALVPTMTLDDGTVLHQSLAMIEYFVHIEAEDAPRDLVVIEADIPAGVSRIVISEKLARQLAEQSGAARSRRDWRRLRARPTGGRADGALRSG